MKSLIAILLAATMITLATAKPYQEAKATGLEGGLIAGGAAGAMSNPAGILVLIGICGFMSLFVNLNDIEDAAKKGKIDKAAEQAKEDFINYSTQALNNKISADEQERDNAAHASAVIDDWLESASAGVIDTTSEAWGWFRDFCSDIRNAINTTDEPATLGGYPLLGDGGEFLVGRTADMPNGTWYATYSIILEGVTLAKECKNAVLVRYGKYIQVRDYLTGDALSGTIKTVKMIRRDYNYLTGEMTYQYGTMTAGTDVGVGSIWDYTGLNMREYNIPLWDSGVKPAAPSGTTDVPGVSNVNDYVAVGSDLPYTRPEGAWDICDPNGKKGQVSIGKDIPGKLGYDDWYDVLGGVANGETTWEQVANASDVIRIGSDTDSPYSRENADAWGAYVDGTIIGYDVTAEGDVVITFEDGRVITIPQEYVSGMEWVNEQDKAQDLDKDTTFPVSGTLVYPLPVALEQDPTADPPGGGSSGEIKVDPEASDYTLDFRKLFPFCIPFDIYKAVKILDASPTAPVVHYKFYFSKSKTYNIDLNLNKFNAVAAILRRMECLLFIVGLATATRRIYLRG